jgi:hypothetical protein
MQKWAPERVIERTAGVGKRNSSYPRSARTCVSYHKVDGNLLLPDVSLRYGVRKVFGMDGIGTASHCKKVGEGKGLQ